MDPQQVRSQVNGVLELAKVAGAELEELEKSGLEHAFGAVELGSLGVKASLTYGRQIVGAFRRVALAATGRAWELTTASIAKP